MCPVCHTEAVVYLPTVSQQSQVDYFLCRSCWHVWNVSKGKDGPVMHVTDPLSPRVVKLKSAS
jgi:hypothetical protein